MSLRPSAWLTRAAALATATVAFLPRASAAQPGVGAAYGTRDPAVCARGSGPRGAPTAAQVAQLVRCDREGVSS